MFSVNTINIKNALVTIFITAIVTVFVYIVGLNNIFQISWHTLINLGVISLLNGFISLAKSFLTDNSGKFAGAVKIVPSTTK